MRSRNRTIWKVLQADRSNLDTSDTSPSLHSSHRSSTGRVSAAPADRSGSYGGGPQAHSQRSNSRPGPQEVMSQPGADTHTHTQRDHDSASLCFAE